MATTEAVAPTRPDSAPLAGLHLVELVIGDVGMPGAPLLHVQALVDAPTGKISGHAQITQASTPPGRDAEISALTGQIRSLGFGPSVRVVTLSGSYAVSVRPPAIGTLLVPVSAMLIVEQDAWVGQGSFLDGSHAVDNVPVHVEN